LVNERALPSPRVPLGSRGMTPSMSVRAVAQLDTEEVRTCLTVAYDVAAELVAGLKLV